MKNIDIIALPSLNVLALGFVNYVIPNLPSFSEIAVVIKSLLEISVLTATLIFTIVKTFQILRNKKNKEQ